MLMFRMFTQFHNFMEVSLVDWLSGFSLCFRIFSYLDTYFFEIKQVEYLPVIYPSDNQKQNAVRLSQKVCVGGE